MYVAKVLDHFFSQGELNMFQELVTTCRLVLPPLEHFLRQLSPAVQVAAFEQQLPPQLLSTLLPELPGGVKVYSVVQLLEYLKVRLLKIKNNF